jgi:hypothetical protein
LKFFNKTYNETFKLAKEEVRKQDRKRFTTRQEKALGVLCGLKLLLGKEEVASIYR